MYYTPKMNEIIEEAEWSWKSNVDKFVVAEVVGILILIYAIIVSVCCCYCFIKNRGVLLE